jgi:hypothetical protein
VRGQRVVAALLKGKKKQSHAILNNETCQNRDAMKREKGCAPFPCCESNRFLKEENIKSKLKVTDVNHVGANIN